MDNNNRITRRCAVCGKNKPLTAFSWAFGTACDICRGAAKDEQEATDDGTHRQIDLSIDADKFARDHKIAREKEEKRLEEKKEHAAEIDQEQTKKNLTNNARTTDKARETTAEKRPTNALDKNTKKEASLAVKAGLNTDKKISQQRDNAVGGEHRESDEEFGVTRREYDLRLGTEGSILRRRKMTKTAELFTTFAVANTNNGIMTTATVEQKPNSTTAGLFSGTPANQATATATPLNKNVTNTQPSATTLFNANSPTAALDQNKIRELINTSEFTRRAFSKL